MVGERPNDRRGFLHKSKFGKFITGVAGEVIGSIPGGDIVTGVVSGIFDGGGGNGNLAAFCATAKRPLNPADAQRCIQSGFAPGETGTDVIPTDLACPEGTIPDPTGADQCVSGASPFGRGQGAPFAFGNAVMGQFGAALAPAVTVGQTLHCPPGAVLGKDSLCYNRRDLRNDERKWPRGTRPLLTGGEMKCIRVASGAARKLRTKEKQLRKMGMLPALPKARKAKALPSGHHAHVAHN